MDFRFRWGFNFDEKSIYCLNVPKFFTKYHIAQNFPDSNNALYFQQDNTLDTYLESIWPWTALTEDELTLSLRLRAQTTWIEALCFLSNSHSPHLCTCFVRRQKSWKNNSFFSKISTVWPISFFWKKVVNIAILELRTVSNESPGIFLTIGVFSNFQIHLFFFFFFEK